MPQKFFFNLTQCGRTTQTAVLHAWTAPYSGDHHHSLLRTINAMPRTAHFSNFVTIFQSSSSGKSRMVWEQANLVFTIPFNLRFSGENKDLAYPYPDKEVWRYFCGVEERLVDAQIRVLLFFRTLFREVAATLRTTFSLGQQTDIDNSALAERWNHYLEEDQNPTELYGKMVAHCKSHVYPSIQKNKGFSIEGCPVAQAAREELDTLLAIIDDGPDSDLNTSQKPVKIMIYFDGAHELAKRRVADDPDRKNIYDVICSCLNSFLAQPIFAIFLSTNSSIYHQAPHGSLARSVRALSDKAKFQAPVSETPFDCHPALPVESGEHTLKDICKIEFMARFGRPLFWALWENVKVAGDETRDKLVIELAVSKFTSNHELNAARGTAALPAKSVVLDVLLMLDYESLRQVAHVQQATLVESHMRIAYSVPSHREYFRSGYSSEPILAEAAARKMNELMQQSPNEDVMAAILEEQFTSGVLDLEQRGEIVMRLLLMKAYLKAVRKEQRSRFAVTFSEGCSLVNFVSELFTELFSSQVLCNTPDNMVGGIVFQEASKDSVVRFTHFVKATDDSATTTHGMFAAFVRGMAMVCHPSQDLVDIVIPVLLNRNDLLAESAMTALLVQVKRRGRKGPGLAYAIGNRRSSLFSSADPEDARPYLTLIAELGTEPLISGAAAAKVPMSDGLRKISPSDVPKTAKFRKAGIALVEPELPSTLGMSKSLAPQYNLRVDRHPRYSVFAYGCSDTVYKVIPAHTRATYSALLANCHVLAEHPRQDDETLSAVRRMKPFWNAGLECYHWIEEL
ncbi:hypothetical protein BJ138DRAFT_621877 [Hygrophoropsis aurantiaca]|uniref:Uncharacterized protein n=1 Tax=Hygrophoropsis aurantiaca TaxID=72124 RepID=A0ACB7ZZE5_9AGAM|nr:hypothetical protein BJ138DRAFT_621877 [Hygrophoropsis aurantiaca]